MLAISVGTLLSYVPMCFAAQTQTALPQTALLIGGTLVAATVQLTFLQTCKDTPAPPGDHGGHGAEPYRLSVYIVSLVSSFGVATSLASGMAYFLGGYQSGSFSWTLVLTILCACAALTALSLLASKGAALRFGLLIRIALVAAGAVFAFAPALQGFAPNVLAALCQAVVIIQGVAMTLLSVEICHEKNLAMSDVMPANYAIYVVCVCSGMGLASMVNASGSGLLWQFMMGIAITSVVAVIPALPSASSTATTFTAKVLLENERYDERSSRVCLETAARYGLTPPRDRCPAPATTWAHTSTDCRQARAQQLDRERIHWKRLQQSRSSFGKRLDDSMHGAGRNTKRRALCQAAIDIGCL